MALEIQGLVPLLQVFDMPASIRFYRDVLGFEVFNSSPPISGADGHFHWAWLKKNGAELMLNTAYESDDERPGNPDTSRVAAHGDTVLYVGCPDVDAAFEHLQLRGINMKKPTIAPYGMKQMTVADPDGYLVCLQCPA